MRKDVEDSKEKEGEEDDDSKSNSNSSIPILSSLSHPLCSLTFNIYFSTNYHTTITNPGTYPVSYSLSPVSVSLLLSSSP
jgi:hypothetical protein